LNDRDLDLVALEPLDGFGQRFERTVHVGLDDEVERRRFAGLDLFEDVFESSAPGERVLIARERGQTTPVLTRRRHSRGDLFGGRHGEAIAGGRRLVETEHLHRSRRAGFVDGTTVIVEQRPHASPCSTRNEWIAHAQRAPLHEDRRDGTATDVEVGFEHHSHRPPARLGPEVFDLGHHCEVVEQFVDAEPLQCRHLDAHGVATPRLGDETVL
jgi:hypothetical protein